MTAVSVIAIVASFYVRYISVSLSFVSALCLVILLARGYFREAILSYIATGLVSFFMGGLAFSLPYLFFYGAYTLLAYILNKYLKIKILGYVIKAVYGVGITLLILLVFKLFQDNAIVQKATSDEKLLCLLTVGVAVGIIVYDVILERIGYPAVCSLLQRVDKSFKKENQKENE